MTTGKRFLAFDLGAESGRAIVGTLDGDRVSLEELHRWPSRNAEIHGVRYWDVLYIFAEMKEALARYARQYGPELAGIGVDTWGVDFGLLGPSGQLLQNPLHYRDHATDAILEPAFNIMPRDELYRRTGIQFMQINTLYQLHALRQRAPEVLDAASTFLTIPDVFNYMLCGRKACEYTEASTTQLLDVHQRTWDADILEAFGLRRELFPEVVPPGTVLGPLSEAIRAETGIGQTAVVAPCTHDTGSAVAAAPAAGSDWAYLSCGTWSLLGAEVDEPRATEEALRHNFTNEGGYGRTIRLLKNIMGLWVLQECRAAWERRGQQYSYHELAVWANDSEPFATLLNIDDPAFLNPPDMLEAIAAQCMATNQAVPEKPGAVARAVLEGLAIRYADVVGRLEAIMGTEVNTLHMLGGGIQNELLCQFTCDAINRTVIAGPVEATAMGNIAVQAIAQGALSGLAEARELIGRSSELKRYEPRAAASWQQQLARFRELYGEVI